MNKMFYKLQCHPRLYLPRTKGGMGLININNSHRATVVSMATYISTSSKHEIQEVFNHEAAKPLNTSIIKPEEYNEVESNENPATKKANRSR